MSNNPRRGGSARPRTHSAAPVKSASAGHVLAGRADTADWRGPAPANQLVSAGRAPARMPLSMFFPVLVLLMISVAWGQESYVEGFDFELGVRFAGYSLAALTGLYALGRGRMRFNIGMLAWALVPIFICVTYLYAPDPKFSLAAGFAHFSLLLFAWWAVCRYGQARTVFMVVLTGLIIGGLSIGFYYLFPNLGRSIANSYTADPGGRMRGIVTQPNTLGSISAITILFATMYFKSFTRYQQIAASLAIVVAAYCLMFSESRSSLAALMLCLLLGGLYRANAAINLFAIVGIALVVCLVIGFVPDVSAYLARADAGPDDLASLNGRSRIWSVVWEYIYAHPIIGQGYGASRLILPNDDRLFSAALNSHNLYLELLFSGGLIMLALYTVGVVICVFQSVTRKRAEALILLLFFLIVGATEASPYGGLPLFGAFGFYTAVSLCLARTNPARRLRQTNGPTLRPHAPWSIAQSRDRFARQWK